MKKENKKRQVAKISVFITSIFVIFLSVTYAFINQTLVGTKRQVIAAGNLELELLEDENNLTIKDALPMYDEVGMLQEAFTFRLINKTTMNTNYVLKLADITTSTDKLDTSIVKYGLVKDGVSSIKLLSTLNDGIIDKGVITGEQTIEYSLRLWINSEVEDEDLIRGKTLSYRIDIEAGQEIEKPVYAMIKKINSGTTEAFWKYADSITSIVFENNIYIPDEVESSKKWDVSADRNRSVMAYIEPNNEESTTYRLHIQGKGGIAANTNSSYLFRNFSKLTTIEGLEYFDTANVTKMYAMFDGCSSLTSLDLSNFDTVNVTDMDYMFNECRSLTSLDLSSFDTTNVTSMGSMFSVCTSLTMLDVSNFNTSNVINMAFMFSTCINLTSLDLSSFDTTKVTNMPSMFQSCRSLTSLDLSNFNTSNVKTMSFMFYSCESLANLDLSHFDTTNVTNMSSMFRDCSSLASLDVSGFNTTSVTDMSNMFSWCSNLTKLDLSNFDTSSVTSMESMFRVCRNLTSLDVSGFNTTSVTNMSNMFSWCSNLTKLDLSNFDTSNVTSMESMFDSLKVDCLITVKDEATKNWILGINSDLTNIVVKGA